MSFFVKLPPVRKAVSPTRRAGKKLVGCFFKKGLRCIVTTNMTNTVDKKFIIPPPRIEEWEVEPRKMCGAGPSDLWPSVVEALTRPVLSPGTEEYSRLVHEIRKGLKYLFQTETELVLAMSGSGHIGMEAVICNLVDPGETLLIASRGIWDERALEVSKRHGINVVVTKVAANSTFSKEDLEPVLRHVRPAAMFITHGDSSTGTVQDLSWVGNLCHKYGAVLLVDAVVSVPGTPFFMDAWGVDAVYASCQKALSGPAGISPVAFSKLAEQRIRNSTRDPPFYFDIKLLAEQWNCYGNKFFYHHTMSTPLLWALRACLIEVCNETLQASWARHRRTMLHFHKRLSEMHTQFYVLNPEHRLPTVTTVCLHEGYDSKEVADYMKRKHKILVLTGLGPTARCGRVLRIGLMGVNARTDVADRVADALADTLKTLRN